MDSTYGAFLGDAVSNDPGPSNASAKRKRDGSGIPSTHYQNGADTHPDDDLEPSNKSSKKKKAARACAHCQKAHLTCDDSRPCQRCIKRGMAESCVEGHRKKAKYLLDEEELESLKKQSKPRNNGKQKEANPSGFPPTRISTDGSNDFDSLMDLSFDPSYRFGSQTANLEYSMLSAILGNPRSETPSSNELPSPLSQSPAGAQSQQWSGMTPPSNPAGFVPLPPELTRSASTPGPSPFRPFGLASPPNSNSLGSGMQLEPAPTPFDLLGGSSAPVSARPSMPPPEMISPPQPPNLNAANGPDRSGQWRSAGDSVYSQVVTGYDYTQGYHFLMRFLSERSAVPFSFLSRGVPDSGRSAAPDSDITATTVFAESGSHQQDVMVSQSPRPLWGDQQPSYLPLSGFTDPAPLSFPSQQSRPTPTSHPPSLINDWPCRFEKNDILRVVRALAIFRPSLIALQMPMTEQDEIFVERALQRSLLELEKLISYSGTPTAIWRRTGEICVVGLEFCMLTGWTKEDLVGQRKFIYELFENQSVVEYWENFASHAFENSTQSVYSHCVLLKPSGDPVPCAFCFTVRRNMFDLPDLIVGQWLPLF